MTGARDLLQPGAPRLWTIPAGTPFLRSLARGLAEASDLAARPDALQDALIYVPNRRSARTLAMELLMAAGGGGALLPPEIRALGDMETDEAPSGAEEALAGLGPALSEAKRTGALMRMVQAYFEQTGTFIPLPGVLAAATALGQLLDQAALAGLEDWSNLHGLVTDRSLARHWERSAKFLEIVTEQWPAWLEAQGANDPLVRRRKAAEALAEHWRLQPPAGPVIIAGSTGSTPASLTLMRAAMALPHGMVVLPGLDHTVSEPDWIAISTVANHHQSALFSTLSSLGYGPREVPVWPVVEADQSARRRLIDEALAPADLTGDWRDRIRALASDGTAGDAVSAALDGFDLIEATDEAHEAELAALIMRAGLERGDDHIALVTPDADLARRVSALLKRWDVVVEPSAGTPLMRTSAGIALADILAWWQEPDHPVHLAALLKSPVTNLPGDKDGFERAVLRGPRRWADFEGLAALGVPAGHGALVTGLRAALETVQGPEMRGGFSWASGLSGLVEALGATSRLWRGAAGEAAARLVDETATLLEPFPDHPLSTFVDVLLARAGAVLVTPEGPGHPRLSIWGPLEARLQSADHLILAGLNEDVWPKRPGADPFLPSHFKRELGLPDPEARMGLMAHDFAGLACARRVTCLYAERRGDAPAVASRWIWRLKTLVQGAGVATALDPAPGADPRPWARALWTLPDALEKPVGFAMPRPRPPVEFRPDRLSVTRVDWLQRDPYAIYAESVLGLRKLDPLNKPVGPAERGTAIHSALEQVGRGTVAFDAGALTKAIEQALAEAGLPASELVAGRAVTAQTAAWCLDWLAERKGTVHPEVKGQLTFDIAGAPFLLTAKADRIEDRGDGLAILDFKTGTPPTQSQIATGLAQQMPLQALIARSGGFEGLPQRAVDELTYVAFKAKPLARGIDGDPNALADEAEAGLVRLVTSYRNPHQPFLSAPRTQFVGYDYGYNRLARRAEWAAETADE
ncbi:MAG: PD-(D/E)XK nuclease family protein [Pseudomonadota bacterium]